MHSFSQLIHGDKPVLVDFSAEWCGPCRMMAPILQELKGRMKDAVIILKVDVDKNQQLATQYRVQSVPTLMIFQNGVVKWRQSGVLPANELEKVILPLKTA